MSNKAKWNYTGVVISDIHFGAIDAEQLKEELMEEFIYHLSGMNKIDFIIIDGDYFDHKLYMNESSSRYAIEIMDEIVEIAMRDNSPIRIVYGTESHEVSQYNIFSVYENNPDLDFKVIRTVQEEELLKDLNVLYIPEEFVYDKKEYYKDYFNNDDKYDYIFGHGVINEVMTQASRNLSKKDTNRKKVPVFTTSELSKICKGQVYFGHYHINTNIDDKIFYVGSFTRWQHGEEEEKGFYELECDVKSEKYSNKFIINTLAKKYCTRTFSYTDMNIDTQEELYKMLNTTEKLCEINDIENVRYIFNIPEDHPNPEFLIKVLNERYKFNDKVKLQITNGYVDKQRKINKEKLNESLSEYPMIFDKSYPLEDKLVYFIKKKWDRDIDTEKVKKYLYDE